MKGWIELNEGMDRTKGLGGRLPFLLIVFLVIILSA